MRKTLAMILVTRARTLPGLHATLPSLVDIEVTDGVISALHPSGGGPLPGAFDADGAVVLPGLWDAHVHLSHHAMVASAIDVSGTGSADEVAAILRQAAARRPGELLLGFGFRSAEWGAPPTARLLDQVSAQPIALISGDAHSFWANSAGLALAGAANHPTGFLVEHVSFNAQLALMNAAADRLDEAIRQVSLEAAAKGVVGVVDMQQGWAVGDWQRRGAGGPPLLRIEAATYPSELDRLIDAGLSTGDAIAERVTVGPLKIIADGSLHSRTALCSHEYPDPLPHLPHGQANYTPEELVQLLGTATAHRIHAAVHAIGDRAVDVVLDSFAVTGARGSVEHAQFVTPEGVRRFAELGVAASVQPAHLLDDAPILDRLWPSAGGQAFPFRDLVDAGVALWMGSDAPVSPLDPWLAMQAAVHRTHHPEQALTALEAIRASTRSTLAPGQPADLVVVDAPPEALLAGAFQDVSVLATFLGGEPTFGG